MHEGLRKAQEEVVAFCTQSMKLDAEIQDLQQENNVLKATVCKAQHELHASDASNTISDMIESAKPYFWQLAAFYHPFAPSSLQSISEKKPVPGILMGSAWFDPDKSKCPDYTEIFVAELHAVLPDAHHDHRILNHSEYRKGYGKTMKQFKSAFVDSGCTSASVILGMQEDEKWIFKSKSKHAEVPQLVSLLSWSGEPGKIDHYPPILFPQWVQEQKSAKGYMRYIFQSIGLFQFIRAFLFGLSSVKEKETLPVASGGKKYGHLWNITRADQLPQNVLFVLSPKEKFGLTGPITNVNWQNLLASYIKDLFQMYEKAEKNYGQIMDLFQADVFRQEDDGGGEDFWDLSDDGAIFNDEAEESPRKFHEGSTIFRTSASSPLSSLFLSPLFSPPGSPLISAMPLPPPPATLLQQPLVMPLRLPPVTPLPPPPKTPLPPETPPPPKTPPPPAMPLFCEPGLPSPLPQHHAQQRRAKPNTMSKHAHSKASLQTTSLTSVPTPAKTLTPHQITGQLGQSAAPIDKPLPNSRPKSRKLVAKKSSQAPKHAPQKSEKAKGKKTMVKTVHFSREVYHQEAANTSAPDSDGQRAPDVCTDDDELKVSHRTLRNRVIKTNI
ncbi:hypothetical protein C0989_003554 [Termitomyces sp. Mn162]|nr:hypothetical protein C0989_003554 [Termitomyces sp. Mn162]